MKKITLLLMVITCISCNSDDDSAIDSIVGEWRLIKTFVNDVEQTISDCDRENIIKIFENGFFVIYTNDNTTGICQTIFSDDAIQVRPNANTIVLTDFPNAFWENVDDGTYTFTLEETVPPINIMFELSNSIFFNEIDGDTTRKNVYIKTGPN